MAVKGLSVNANKRIDKMFNDFRVHSIERYTKGREDVGNGVNIKDVLERINTENDKEWDAIIQEVGRIACEEIAA